MNGRLENKNIIVTAAGQGIGKATAIAFYNEGANVTATDLNEKTLQALNKEYPKIKIYTLDSTNASAIKVFSKTIKKVDVLFNAVGFVHHGTILDCEEKDWDFSFNVNIKSITADSVNGLTTRIVLNDEKDFQKGLTQQLLGIVDQREHTLLKSGVGANTDNQPVQQWRKEQLTANTNEWGQRLLHVLSDKVNLQIGQQVQRAQIRLDPPQLGSIDISISVEGDKTTVHLVAGNAQIREAMQQTLDQLRQSLSQTGDVTVEVDVGEKQQESGNSSDTPEIDIAENITVEEDIALKTTENSASDWLNRLV